MITEPLLGDEATNLQGSSWESFVTKKATFLESLLIYSQWLNPACGHQTRSKRSILGDPHHANTYGIGCGVHIRENMYETDSLEWISFWLGSVMKGIVDQKKK